LKKRETERDGKGHNQPCCTCFSFDVKSSHSSINNNNIIDVGSTPSILVVFKFKFYK